MNAGANPVMSAGFHEAWSSSRMLGEAGQRAYARGVAYQRDRRVELAEVTANRVRALVRGTVPYSVTLGVSGRAASWSCTCPVGEDGAMCKHTIAVALAVSGVDDAVAVVANTAPTASDDENLATFVAGLDHDELVAVILAQADMDWRLREQLRARAAAAMNAPIDERVWRRRINEAFAPYDDFVGYHEAAGWAREVEEILAAVGELVDTHPAQAVALLEYAHSRANASMQLIDDSDGYLTSISSDIEEMHLAACESARPDPVALARRLVDLELTSELDAFHRAAATYADVLGVAGLAEYQRLIEPAWDKLGDDDDVHSIIRDYSIREAMIGVALASGDADELIRVLSRSLRSPADYLEIVRGLTDVGRRREAIAWAQRGLTAMAERTWQTPPLREALAAQLREEGDIVGSVKVFDDEYQRSPSLAAYRRLLDEADLIGERCATRTAALNHLHRKVATQPTNGPGRPSDVMIEILMFEGEVDDAWAIAGEHGCADGQWLRLAAARQHDHPLDAVPIYQRAALAAIDARNTKGYAIAVDYLGRIRQLAQQAGAPALFTGLLGEIRANHKPKRNLMALLDRKHWQ